MASVLMDEEEGGRSGFREIVPIPGVETLTWPGDPGRERAIRAMGDPRLPTVVVRRYPGTESGQRLYPLRHSQGFSTAQMSPQSAQHRSKDARLSSADPLRGIGERPWRGPTAGTPSGHLEDPFQRAFLIGVVRHRKRDIEGPAVPRPDHARTLNDSTGSRRAHGVDGPVAILPEEHNQTAATAGGWRAAQELTGSGIRPLDHAVSGGKNRGRDDRIVLQAAKCSFEAKGRP
jgi:hypothetical protein